MSENNELVIFDDIKQTDSDKTEFWSARDLQKTLEYGTWERSEPVIKKAKKSFNASGLGGSDNINDHFRQAAKMVELGSGATRKVDDYQLSRYACFLIAQNTDPSKTPVAIAQAYFNIQIIRYLWISSSKEKGLRRFSSRTRSIVHSYTNAREGCILTI